MRKHTRIVVFGFLVAGCGGGNTGPENAGQAAPGAQQTAKTSALEAGANIELNSGEKREQRSDLVSVAKAQGGVLAMADRFPNAQAPIAGVQDNGDAATKPVPTFSLDDADGNTVRFTQGVR